MPQSSLDHIALHIAEVYNDIAFIFDTTPIIWTKMKIVGLGVYILLCSAIASSYVVIAEFPVKYSHTVDTTSAGSNLRIAKIPFSVIPKATLPQVPKSVDDFEKRVQMNGNKSPPLPDDLTTTTVQQKFTNSETAWEKNVEKAEVNRAEPVKGWLVHPKKDSWFGSRWMRSRLNRL